MTVLPNMSRCTKILLSTWKNSEVQPVCELSKQNFEIPFKNIFQWGSALWCNELRCHQQHQHLIWFQSEPPVTASWKTAGGGPNPWTPSTQAKPGWSSCPQPVPATATVTLWKVNQLIYFQRSFSVSLFLSLVTALQMNKFTYVKPKNKGRNL